MFNSLLPKARRTSRANESATGFACSSLRLIRLVNVIGNTELFALGKLCANNSDVRQPPPSIVSATYSRAQCYGVCIRSAVAAASDHHSQQCALSKEGFLRRFPSAIASHVLYTYVCASRSVNASVRERAITDRRTAGERKTDQVSTSTRYSIADRCLPASLNEQTGD